MALRHTLLRGVRGYQLAFVWDDGDSQVGLRLFTVIFVAESGALSATVVCVACCLRSSTGIFLRAFTLLRVAAFGTRCSR